MTTETIEVPEPFIFKRVKGACPACGHDSEENDDPCIHERQPEDFILAPDGTIHHKDTRIQPVQFGKAKVWVGK